MTSQTGLNWALELNELSFLPVKSKLNDTSNFLSPKFDGPDYYNSGSLSS